MDLLLRLDEQALLWVNGWVGRVPWLDAIVGMVVSDYLVPVLLSLVLLGLWFSGNTQERRGLNQRAVMAALLGVLLVDGAIMALNQSLFRPRPFVAHDLSLLFYQPTDSSFPANPVAVTFVMAAGVWLWNQGVGRLLLGVAAIFAVLRVYAGVFYPLDVIGGGLMGVGFAVLVTLAVRLIEPLPTLVLRLARFFYLA